VIESPQVLGFQGGNYFVVHIRVIGPLLNLLAHFGNPQWLMPDHSSVALALPNHVYCGVRYTISVGSRLMLGQLSVADWADLLVANVTILRPS
jgi:hypothetical protein